MPPSHRSPESVPARPSTLIKVVYLTPLLSLGTCYGGAELGLADIAVPLGFGIGVLGLVLFVVAYVRVARSNGALAGLAGLKLYGTTMVASVGCLMVVALASLAIAAVGLIGLLIWAFMTNTGFFIAG